MRRRPRVGVLGGTFDPIHVGHLAAVRATARVVPLDIVRFVPSARPPHRPDSPHASEYHRLEMIRLALGEAEVEGATTCWEVCDLELRRGGPSYTFDTLRALHSEGLTPLQIFFITGADAFAEIATWHRYPAVLDAAHFAVVARPGIRLDTLTARLPSLGPRMIRATDFTEPESPQILLVEADTPDVSSTSIRRRAERGESLAGLVPTPVAAYIEQHSLYSPGR